MEGERKEGGKEEEEGGWKEIEEKGKKSRIKKKRVK